MADNREDRPVIDLVGNRHWFYLFSGLILLIGIIALLIPPRLNLGIDFLSGSEFTVRFQEEVSQGDLNDAMGDFGHSEARVQGTGPNEFLVRTDELRGAGDAPPVGPAPVSERDEIENSLIERFGHLLDADNVVQDNFLQFDSISATVSGEINVAKSFWQGRPTILTWPPSICCGITGNAITAVAWASAAIFLYLWWSFRAMPNSFRLGTAAVVALIHDVVIVLGAFSILGKTIDAEINIFFIAAILTVVGFSVHDSIVVFDRIRETVERQEARTFKEAVNSSLLQTLTRSLNTSLTLVFAILTLMLMGGAGIQEFLWAMLIGTIAGTYSSIAIAAQILVSWEEGDVPRLFRRITGRSEQVQEPEPELEPDLAPEPATADA
ncbi:MAG: protein translocase subunit SecF [Chloroflexi bacterium]|nr:protein translocase subunit SecF [Chloroflexota bacterium]